ncbi:MAG: hypothetical protein Q7R52_03370 [archaeon]|nr:hypothetical protein [archaeon]
MASDLTTILATALTGLMGVLIGAITNHQLNAKYSRKDMVFKKKLEYFEKIVETLEKNKKIYHNALYKIEDSKKKNEIEDILEELKQNRQNFLVMASPLYFDTRRFSDKIINFVEIEKGIFNKISNIKNNKEKSRIIQELREDLERLNNLSSWIIRDMKRELTKK